MELIEVEILGYKACYTKDTGSICCVKDAKDSLCVLKFMQVGTTIRASKERGLFLDSSVEYLGVYSNIDGTDILIPNKLWGSKKVIDS